jgi:hypothetical protein
MGNDVGEGAVLDQIVRVLQGRTAKEQRRIIVALADRFDVELASKTEKRSLGRDDFGNRIHQGDEMLGYTSTLGTSVSVSLSGLERDEDG